MDKKAKQANIKKSYIGLRPVSMPEKTFTVVVVACLVMLLLLLVIMPFLLFQEHIGWLSLVITLILPVLMLPASMWVYAKIYGLDPKTAEKARYRKGFIAVFILVLVALPVAAILIIEPADNVGGMLTSAGAIILFFVALAVLCGLFYLINFAVFTLFKREYQKNKAALMESVFEYVRTDLSSNVVRVSEDIGIRFMGKNHMESPGCSPLAVTYDSSYSWDFRQLPDRFPLVLHRRYKKSDFSECIVAMDCLGYARKMPLIDSRDVLYGWKLVDYIRFSVIVQNGRLSDDLQRQIAYYHAQNVMKPLIREYLAGRFPNKEFSILEVKKYGSGFGPNDDYDDLSGDISATAVIINEGDEEALGTEVVRTDFDELFSIDVVRKRGTFSIEYEELLSEVYKNAFNKED